MSALLALRALAAWLGRHPQALMLIGAAALAALVYAWGGRDATRAQKIERIEAALEAGEIRRRANARAMRSDDVDLCVALGGVRDACAAVLGAEPPAASE